MSTITTDSGISTQSLIAVSSTRSSAIDAPVPVGARFRFFSFLFMWFLIWGQGSSEGECFVFYLTHKYIRNAPFCLVDYVFASIKICPIVEGKDSQSQRGCSCRHNLVS